MSIKGILCFIGQRSFTARYIVKMIREEKWKVTYKIKRRDVSTTAQMIAET